LCRIDDLVKVAAEEWQREPVVNNIKPDKKSDKQLLGRETYTVPKLTEFGHVGALTQGGAGSTPESGMSQNQNRQVMA
jgi:hypothetical protein